MPTERIQILASNDPENSISSLAFGTEATNVMYDRYPDDRPYVTQRPGVRITAEPENFGLNGNGRGIHFWEEGNGFYIVNNDRVEAGYGTPVGTISPGRDRVYFVEAVGFLIILDPENNEGWYIDVTSPTTITKITDTDFPPNQNPQRQLAGGGVFLDGFVFVLDDEGTIWNSDINDPRAWNALNFITAERETDRGVFLTKHHDQIVALGNRSIEFFFNAGNPVASPLARRQDVSYRTGAIDRKSVFDTGDLIIFIGSEQSGTQGLYEIDEFQLRKRSSMAIDESIVNLSISRSNDFILSSAYVNDHQLVFITPVTDAGTSWSSSVTYVFDGSTGSWSNYVLNNKDVGGFPVVDVADKEQGTDRSVTLLFLSGDVADIRPTLEPLDGTDEVRYFEQDDYIENQDDYIISVGVAGTVPISISFTLPEKDFGTMQYKFCHSLWLVGSAISGKTGSTPINISWTDDHYDTFSANRQVDISTHRRITRLGNFRRRAFRISYQGEDTVRIEGLEIYFGVSRYA